MAKFVVIASDVSPEEVVIHIPKLCKQKNIPYVFVPTKQDLGKAISLNVGCASVAVENVGDAKPLIDEIVSRLTGVSKPTAEQAPKQEKQEKKQDKPAPKQENKPTEKQ